MSRRWSTLTLLSELGQERTAQQTQSDDRCTFNCGSSQRRRYGRQQFAPIPTVRPFRPDCICRHRRADAGAGETHRARRAFAGCPSTPRTERSIHGVPATAWRAFEQQRGDQPDHRRYRADKGIGAGGVQPPAAAASGDAAASTCPARAGGFG
jgi:hypothetical protein